MFIQSSQISLLNIYHKLYIDVQNCITNGLLIMKRKICVDDFSFEKDQHKKMSHEKNKGFINVKIQ